MNKLLTKNKQKKLEKLFPKVLTNPQKCDIIYTERKKEVNKNDVCKIYLHWTGIYG